jgi:large subunit ribosomal protein L14e
VQVGRVAVINYGPDYGKICVIVDIIDHNRVLIDGPEPINGIARQPYNLRRLALTRLRFPLAKGARSNTLLKAFNHHKILDKWRKSSWAKKIIARQNKDNLTDFQRFVVATAKSKKNYALSRAMKNILQKKRKARKLKRQATKLLRQGKDLPKKLSKVLPPSKREAIKKGGAPPTKKEKKEKRDAAAAAAKKEKKEKKPKQKKHGLAFLEATRLTKLHRSLAKKAQTTAAHNLKKRKRAAEKKKKPAQGDAATATTEKPQKKAAAAAASKSKTGKGSSKEAPPAKRQKTAKKAAEKKPKTAEKPKAAAATTAAK